MSSVYITFLIAGISIIALSFFSLSVFHHRKIKNYLDRNIPVDKQVRESAKDIGVDSVVAVSISLFDVLYNTSHLDPFVLKGIEHLHHAQEFQNLGDLVRFMKSNIIDSEKGTKAWRQMIHKYKGYTGEEQAFDKISHSSDSIQIPRSGTNPDFDAIINGNLVDIAITDNPSYIQAKLDSNPNIFVWTNKEMEDAFSDNPRVIVDPDLSSQNAYHATDAAISGIESLGDLINKIPLITFCISATRHTIGVAKGNKDVKTAIEHTALDTAGVGIGFWGGGQSWIIFRFGISPSDRRSFSYCYPHSNNLIRFYHRYSHWQSYY